MKNLSAQWIVALACVLLAGTAQAAAWRWIGPDQVRGMLREGGGPWLIDVRSAGAYEGGRIEGSVNIPAAMLRYKKFPPTKRLVLIDDSLGLRAAREAAEALAGKGRQNVFILEGGIPAWEKDGLPMVVRRDAVRSVTAQELKWARENNATVTVVDMRSAEERKKAGTFEGSEVVEGKDMRERLEGLKTLLQRQKTGGMAGRLATTRTMVLVFSASDDAERSIRSIPHGMRGDMRYLIGGYAAVTAKRATQVVGACPTCPGKGK